MTALRPGLRRGSRRARRPDRDGGLCEHGDVSHFVLRATTVIREGAPDLDATLTPTVLSKRGAGLESEFRYLRPHWRGEINGFWLPRDLTAGLEAAGRA